MFEFSLQCVILSILPVCPSAELCPGPVGPSAELYPGPVGPSAELCPGPVGPFAELCPGPSSSCRESPGVTQPVVSMKVMYWGKEKNKPWAFLLLHLSGQRPHNSSLSPLRLRPLKQRRVSDLWIPEAFPVLKAPSVYHPFHSCGWCLGRCGFRWLLTYTPMRPALWRLRF